MRTADEGTTQRSQPTAMLTEAERVERIKALVTYSKFYLSAMATCLCSYSLLWLVYAFAQSRYGWETLAWQKGEDIRLTWWMSNVYFGFSLFALIIIGVLLLMVMWMARAIIGEVQHQTSNRFEFLNRFYLKHGAAEAPFLTLIFFLTIFLGVSYLFGFAFAFHDKTQFYKDGNKINVEEPALVMRNPIMPTGSPKETVATPSPTSSPVPIAIIKFDVGTSKPNSEAGAEVSKAVTAIEQRSKDDKPVRVLLIGGADLRQIRSLAYQSNYELAEARALNVKNDILEELSASKRANILRNLEWTCLAEPNEGRISKLSPSSKPQADSDTDEGKDDRTVKVLVVESYEMPTGLLVRNLRANYLKPLSLMDYVYFANYTITTTGYGDIVPNTVYAKFICSFANISEVLFLVVFFNALLSVGGLAGMSTMSRQMGELYAKYLR
jgi:hypothetical protein